MQSNQYIMFNIKFFVSSLETFMLEFTLKMNLQDLSKQQIPSENVAVVLFHCHVYIREIMSTQFVLVLHLKTLFKSMKICFYIDI